VSGRSGRSGPFPLELLGRLALYGKGAAALGLEFDLARSLVPSDAVTRALALRQAGPRRRRPSWRAHPGSPCTTGAHSYEVVTSGFNDRLDEVRAALGLVQLRRLDEGTDRDELRTSLQQDRIQTRVHHPPVRLLGVAGVRRPVPLDVTEELAPRLLTLSLYPTLGKERVDLVADALLAKLQVSVS
jgi:dTDP-4-amino-4,6-dideoxygalactose transaminase